MAMELESLRAFCRKMVESEKFKKFSKKEIGSFFIVFLFIGIVIICVAVKTKTTKGSISKLFIYKERGSRSVVKDN